MKRVTEKTECDTEGCESDAACGGYCMACYSGMRRLLKQDLSYLAAYSYRVARLGSRAAAATAALRPKRRKAA